MDDTIEGLHRPSSEFPFHRAIYNARPDIRAIVHAHPVALVAFSVTNIKLDARTIPESYIFLRDVERIPPGLQYLSPARIDDYVSPKNPAALLENDGVVVVGSSILDTFDRLEVLETTAEAIINSRPIGLVSPMSDGVINELRTAFAIE